MSKIKLIAIDLDGTWLRSDCSISEVTKGAIQKAIDQGYLVVPTTGRSYRNSREVLKEFRGLRYFINANGSTIADGEEERMIYAECIPYETARAIYELLVKYDAFAEIYEDFDAHVASNAVELLNRAGLHGDYVEQLMSTNVIQESLDAFMENPERRISKFHIVCATPRKKDELKAEIAQLEGVYPISVFNRNIEIVNGTWSKAQGLWTLTKRLGLDASQVMAIGDSNNDLDMLKWAGISVVMGNAGEHVKELADFVTASNDEDGIKLALARYLDELD